MRYVDLNILKAEDVYGRWEVFKRVVNERSADNVFSDVRLLEIEAVHYRSINGKEHKGNWQVIREKDLIYNPIIKFYIEEEQVGYAIITRLFSENADQGEVHKLTLYFNTGLELLLHKKTA